MNGLGERDSIVVLQIDSMKPAKVAIDNCTVESTVYGIEPPSKIILSFLHFPNCRKLSVGRRYLCRSFSSEKQLLDAPIRKTWDVRREYGRLLEL